MPSMATRASVTRAEVARMAEDDVLQMTTQLAHWGTKLDELVAESGGDGQDASTGEPQGIDDLKTKYEVARARFNDFKRAGSSRWEIFKAGIERAWNELEGAFEKWAS